MKKKPLRYKKARPARKSGLVVGLASGVLIGAAALYLWMLGGSRPPEPAPIGAPFQLESSNGGMATPASFKDRMTLVYFGYIDCPDICPTTLQTVKDAFASLGPAAAHVQLVFITVDPKHDDAKRLHDYLAGFSPDFVGLTGSAAQIDRLEKSYDIEAKSLTGQGAVPRYDHSSVLFLMDRNNRFVTAFPTDTGPDSLARQLHAYVE